MAKPLDIYARLSISIAGNPLNIRAAEGSGNKHDVLAERMARLKRQAEFYRVGIVHGRQHGRRGALRLEQ